MGEHAVKKSDWHRVGAGLSVQFEFRAGRIGAEWQPRMPTRAEMESALAAYRSARDSFLAEVGRSLGRTILILEIPL